MRLSRVDIWIYVILLFGLTFNHCTKNPASNEPQLSISVSSVTFEAGGVTVKTITLNNDGAGDLTWSASELGDVPWLSISPASGAAGEALTVTITPAGLAGGSHNATIQVTSNGGDASLPVVALISELLVSENVVFSAVEDIKQLEIQNVGAGDLNWTLSIENTPWLSASALSGANGATVTLTVDRTGLATGSHDGSLVINSTGGSETVAIAMNRLPSAVFLEEFNDGLSDWTLTEATGAINGGIFELTGNGGQSLGEAAHTLAATREAPWLYRASIGMNSSAPSALISIAVLTDDDVVSSNVIVPAFRFDIVANDNDKNWIAGGFVFNVSTLQGSWGFLTNGIGTSGLIKAGNGELNDVALAIKTTKVIELSVDGNLFLSSSDILSLENQIGEEITIGLDQVYLWTDPNVTAIADWALVRDQDVPGKVAPRELPRSRREIIEYARQEALRQIGPSMVKSMQPIQEVIRQLR